MHTLGFSLQATYPVPMAHMLQQLRDIGFRAVSPVRHADCDLGALTETAARLGLTVQSLHGCHRGIPALWQPDPARSQPLLQELLWGIDDCAAYGIPLLVVHPWSTFDYTFDPEHLYFRNFDTLVAYAAEKGVQIAFENLEGPEFLCALMARYASCSHIGYCWDAGHEQCYTPAWDMLARFGDRLIMTHLNDNLGLTHPEGLLQGTDDLHLLPFDGIANWETLIHRLKQARPQQILNFELKVRPKADRCKVDLYSHLPPDRYLALAYERACRVADLYFG